MSRKSSVGWLLVLLLLVAAWPGGSDDGSPRPDEQDAPIEVDGLHVLILYESEEWDQLTPEQIDVIQSATQAGELRKWLDANTEDWAVYDDDTNLDNAEPWVRDAVGVHGDEVPWLLVANTDSGYVGPLPATVNATIELLEKNR